MKRLLLLVAATLFVAACSSTKVQTYQSPDGYALQLPSDWSLVERDDTMPNSLNALAPSEDNFQSRLVVDVSTDFASQPKNETINQLKERLTGRKLYQSPRVIDICGEPALTYGFKRKAASPANPLMTIDEANFGCFICEDSKLYSLTFTCLGSKAPEFQTEVVDRALASFRTQSYFKREAELEARRREALAAEERAEAAFAQAKEEESAFDTAVTKEQEEVGEAVQEFQKASEEVEAAPAEQKQAVQSEAEKARAEALARIEAAKAAAQEAEEKAAKAAREAKDAASAAKAKAQALSEAQQALDAMEGRKQEESWETLVDEKGTPATEMQLQIPAAPAQPAVQVETPAVKVETPAAPAVKVETPAAPAQPAAPANTLQKKDGQFVMEMM